MTRARRRRRRAGPEATAARAGEPGGRHLPRRVPTSTYRLQFGPALDLAGARALVPYLAALGVGDLYSSPLFAARAGSAHGYDVCDPRRLDPARGSEEDLAALAAELRERGMGLLLDIVPNHMAASPENPWWRDVLVHGRASPYAGFFDIDWEDPDPDLRGKVLLPILGGPLAEVLAAGELTLSAGNGGGEGDVALRYHEHVLPLAAESQAAGRLLEARANSRLEPAALRCLLAAQHYRLAFWRRGMTRLNYRRFFDIADLAGVRVEEPAVFAAIHELALRLCREGTVTGLRVDHVDGMWDPLGYLERLQGELAPTAPPFYVVVEKILAGDERLPAAWPVAGTTGYGFLNAVTGLFVEPQGLDALDRFYRRYTGRQASFDDVRYRRQKAVLEELFAAELSRLTASLAEIAGDDPEGVAISRQALGSALAEVTACLPVYRTYIRAFEITARDRRYLEDAFAEAGRRGAGTRAEEALPFLRRLLFLEAPPEHLQTPTETSPGMRLRFIGRWQQLTGAVTAKGLEDTALYVYNRLISLNAVGGEPAGVDPPGDLAAFHARNRERHEGWPAGLSATSTHDSKRSEDVRARINVLSEIPAEWSRRVERWTELNGCLKIGVGDARAPSPNEEIFLYQTLVGVWPLAEIEEPELRDRLTAYLVKALREAKTRSSWLDPDLAYEEAVIGFAHSLLDGATSFLRDFRPFQERVAFLGAWGSLSQLLLKAASPGVPDIYQGTELWDFSLVDPDNRRAVDFALRERLLADLEAEGRGELPSLAERLVAGWRDGRVKLFTTWRALRLRRERGELFLHGDYLPIEVGGARRRHVCAFARRLGASWVIVAVPRWLAGLIAPGQAPVGEIWKEARLCLPEGAPGRWRNALTGEELDSEDGVLPAAAVFARFPGALLTA